jgi:AraC family transcriptional regulator
MRHLTQLWNELAGEAPAAGLFADQAMREVLYTLAARTLHRLRDYVESSLAVDVNVVMMANVAAMSPAYFSRAFAATVGMTPFRYVMTRRLARAHELLQRTRRPVLAIALDMGFKTPSHFTSRFRREFGATPRGIRSDSRGDDVRLD